MHVNQVDEAVRHKWLLDTLKLTTTLSTSNMYLLEADGVLQRYDSADRILKEFYDFRLKYYEYRMEAMLKELEKDLEHLENQHEGRNGPSPYENSETELAFMRSLKDNAVSFQEDEVSNTSLSLLRLLKKTGYQEGNLICE